MTKLQELYQSIGAIVEMNDGIAFYFIQTAKYYNKILHLAQFRSFIWRNSVPSFGGVLHYKCRWTVVYKRFVQFVFNRKRCDYSPDNTSVLHKCGWTVDMRLYHSSRCQFRFKVFIDICRTLEIKTIMCFCQTGIRIGSIKGAKGLTHIHVMLFHQKHDKLPTFDLFKSM